LTTTRKRSNQQRSLRMCRVQMRVFIRVRQTIGPVPVIRMSIWLF
uniref:Capsid protein n=1 Tax=Toxocara canis TaxID=6265 RepID=A0A183U9P6_TOXCA